MSLRQIADATKISVAVLGALARNDISKLPGGIFDRAFVRNYAIEVGLDPEATIVDFITQFPNDSVVAGHPTSGQVEDNVAVESERRTAGTFLWLVVVSVPIVAGLLYFATIGRRAASEPVRPAAGSSPSELVAAAPPPAPVLEPPAASPVAAAPLPVGAPSTAAAPPTAAATPAGDQLTSRYGEAPVLGLRQCRWPKSLERQMQPGVCSKSDGVGADGADVGLMPPRSTCNSMAPMAARWQGRRSGHRPRASISWAAGLSAGALIGRSRRVSRRRWDISSRRRSSQH